MTVRIINDGLPEALYAAIVRQRRPLNPDPYSITVTELLAPPRARALLRQAHAAGTVIEIPASRLVPAFLGTCLHAGLVDPYEAGKFVHGAQEQRLHAEVRVFMGEAVQHSRWDVSGQPDLIDQDGIIHDYKLTKVFALKDGWAGESDDPESHWAAVGVTVNWCGKAEWVQQLNLYAELARRNSIAVKGLRLTAFLKDYQEKGFKKQGVYFPSTREQYPWLPSDTTTLHVPLWPTEQATAFLHERLAAHEAAMAELPECTNAETWGGRRCQGWCDAYAVCEQANALYRAHLAGQELMDYQDELWRQLQDTAAALKGGNP
jgi:hypothetical protein